MNFMIFPKVLIVALLSVFGVFLPLSPTFAQEDDPGPEGRGEGPWRPSSLVNMQVFGAIHFLDRSDVNHYIEQGGVEEFGSPDENGYLSRATPVVGVRLAFVQKRFVGDLMLQYYKQWREGPDTGSMISGIHFLFHLGYNITQRTYQIYPFVGLGWSYTNFVVNGDERCIPFRDGGSTIYSDPENIGFCKNRDEFPDFAGAKKGVPGDVGIGFELQNPRWDSEDSPFRRAVNFPVFVHLGYQGELITYFWQTKHGRLERAVLDRFMGPYLRVGFGFGRGKYY